MVKKRCLCKMGGINMADDETLKRQKLINKAKEMYSKGCKYKDISKEIGIPESTIKSWRRRKQWSRKKTASYEQTVAGVTLSSNEATDDRWKQFCLRYLKTYNATQAYMDVYNVKYNTASVNGSRLLKKAKIKSYIRNVKKQQEKELFISSTDVIRELAKIAFANIGDYVDVKTIKTKRVDLKGNDVLDIYGEPIIDEQSQVVMKDKDKDNIDWSVVKDIHYGQDGLVVNLYDKLQALFELLKRLPDSNEERILKGKADLLDTDNNKKMSQIDRLLLILENKDN